MKILIIANSPDGLLTFRYDLLLKLKETNELVLVCPLGNEDANARLNSLGQFVPLEMERRGMNILKDWKLLVQYKKIVKKVKPDKVITYTIKCNIYGGFACPKKVGFYPNITGLGTAFQGGFLKKLVIFLYKTSIKKKAKCVFFENASNKDVFVKNKIVKEEKTVVLKGAGVNLEKYAYKELPNNQIPQFVFVGRIMKEKGIEELLWAIKKLNCENIQAKFIFLGNFEENYKNTIDEYQEQGLINYYGVVNNVSDFIYQSDCLVLPSYHEGMSNAILEACSCGRPVIVSDIPGCREAVNEEKNGFLCEVKNKESLFDCLKNFVMLGYEEKVEMGKESRAFMEKVFDKKIIVQATFDSLMNIKID